MLLFEEAGLRTKHEVEDLQPSVKHPDSRNTKMPESDLERWLQLTAPTLAEALSLVPPSLFLVCCEQSPFTWPCLHDLPTKTD